MGLAKEEELRLSELSFADYWPDGSPALVRQFLRAQYDPSTMPRLEVNRDEQGKLWLMGWDRSKHPEGLGLLEAARGWGLTSDEHEWVMLSQLLAGATMGTVDGSSRSDAHKRRDGA